MFKLVKCSLALVLAFGFAFAMGCTSRTQANVGPVHFGGDLKTHDAWTFGIGTSPGRVEFNLGLVTAAVDGKITECTQAVAVSHETKLIQEENTDG